MKFDLVPLRIGGVAPPLVTDAELALYGTIVSIVHDEPEVQYAGPTPPFVHAVASDIVNEDSARFRLVLEAAFADSVKNDAECTLLDLSGLSALRGSVSVAGAEWLSSHIPDIAKRLILLLDEYPEPEGEFWRLLELHVREDRVAVIAHDGHSSKREGNTDAAILATLKHFRTDPVDGLREKLVRVPGWFLQENDVERVWERSYYDGSLCGEEIYQLIREVLAARRPHVVVTHSPSSNWLERPLRAAALTEDIEFVGLDEFSEWCGAQPPEREISVALVVPMFDTGRTLEEALSTVQQVDRTIVTHPIAVLSTEGTQQAKGTRYLDVRTPVSYLAKVPQDLVPCEDKECAVCTLGVPASAYDPGATSLSVYEFWDVILQTGTIEEADVPPYRDAGDRVPDIYRIVSEYGPWFAVLLMNLIKQHTKKSESELLILCPDERVSRTFVSVLHALFGVSIIRVPRKWIEAASTNPSGVAEANEPWSIRLKSATYPTVVVFDEFTRTGKTLRNLNSIVRELGITVRLGAVLVDMRQANADYLPFAISSLYRLPVSRVEA